METRHTPGSDFPNSRSINSFRHLQNATSKIMIQPGDSSQPSKMAQSPSFNMPIRSSYQTEKAFRFGAIAVGLEEQVHGKKCHQPHANPSIHLKKCQIHSSQVVVTHDEVLVDQHGGDGQQPKVIDGAKRQDRPS